MALVVVGEDDKTDDRGGLSGSCWRTWSSVISFRSGSGRIRIRDSGRKIESCGPGFAGSGQRAGGSTCGGAAGDGGALASEGLASLLELEIAHPPGSAAASDRIRGELLKLGIAVSNRSIRRYRWRRVQLGDHQPWRTFLRNELRSVWAADLFVVQTVSYRILYVFFLLRHERREWLPSGWP